MEEVTSKDNRRTWARDPSGTKHNTKPVRLSTTIYDVQMLMGSIHVARCDKYLCPHTLSCVHFPHHCPCAFPAVEDKIEFKDGSMACVSKGGFKAGEAARKVDLARKGLL